jgi:hypothetical protein
MKTPEKREDYVNFGIEKITFGLLPQIVSGNIFFKAISGIPMSRLLNI